MIYVFRPAGSQSARALADAVDGIRIRREENLRKRARPIDKIVMWGAYVPNITGLVLNNVPLGNKYSDATRLRDAGVRTVEVSQSRPMTTPTVAGIAPLDPLVALWDDAQDAAEAFTNLPTTRQVVALEGITELIGKLRTVSTAMQRPQPVAPPAVPVPTEGWLGRRLDHVGGNDLLQPTTAPQYWSKKEQFVKEYRVHSFFGKSIRAGVKIIRDGYFIPGTTHPSGPQYNGQQANPWIRSWDGGWMISYADDFATGKKKQAIRDISHAAVTALGLNFGAVDIGELADGTLVVLEVNRAPGIELGTIEAYARAARKWTTGEWLIDGTTTRTPASAN